MMMMTSCSAMFRLSILCLLIPAAVSMSFDSIVCQDEHPLKPMLNNTEYKRRQGPSPFRLRLTKDTSNLTQAGVEQYKVEISAGKNNNELLSFAIAQIAVVKTESCGYGALSFKSGDFYQETPSTPCPTRLMTTAPEKMLKTPSLLWKPPPCGCVQFRVMLFEDNSSYYHDDINVSNGNLTATVCVKKREDRQQYINALCRVRRRYSAAEIVSRSSFKVRHSLRDAADDKTALVAMYENRLQRLAHCCEKGTLSYQEKCMSRTRYHRVDRLCEDGIPDLSFTPLRRAYTRRQEKNCCFLMGSHRYTCFNHKSGFPANSSEAGILDYSLDETDPLNDLSDIATSQDGDILSMLSRLEFGAEFENVEIFNMKDIGSKRVSSEEASSRSSLEHTEGRRKPAMQNFKSQSSYNLKSHPSLKRESRFMKAADTQQTQALPLPPSKTMKATPSSRRRASGGSSRRNGRKKWRNSGRKRNRGQRRRSGKASREAKRRGKSFEKRKRQSRASARRASKAASRAHEAEWTSTEMNQRRLDRQQRPVGLRRRCCSSGIKYGSSIENYEKCDEKIAQMLSMANLLGENARSTGACVKQFSLCCGAAFFRSDRNDMRLMRRRDRAREVIDEGGEELDLGGDLAQSDEDSEKRFQSQRSPKARRDDEEDDEEEDGPARFDKADNDQESGKAEIADERGDERRGDTPKSSGRLTAATEEVDSFDDRAFGGSREEEDEDEDDDEEDGEGEDVDDDDEEEDDEDEYARAATNRKEFELGDRRQNGQRSSQRRLDTRTLGSQNLRSSRNRGRVSRKRVSRGHRTLKKHHRRNRGRNSRERRNWLRLSREMTGQYRSLSSRQNNRRNSREGRKRNMGGNSKRFRGRARRILDGHGAEIDDRPYRQGLHNPMKNLDSKEQREAYAKEMSDGMKLVEDYYRL